MERCATGKSFDYRLLHAVALKQCGMRAEEPLLEALKVGPKGIFFTCVCFSRVAVPSATRR